MKEKEININWSAPEFRYKEKGDNWFWYLASSALAVILMAILMKNYLLAFFALLATLVIAITGSARPKTINFSVEPKGITAGSQVFPFKELESFSIVYDPPLKKELVLKQKKKLAGFIKLPLADTDPNLVRKFLLKVLPEEEFEESLTDLITEKIGI